MRLGVARDRKPIGTATGANIYDEDYSLLEMRVKRLDTGLVGFEDPKSGAPVADHPRRCRVVARHGRAGCLLDQRVVLDKNLRVLV